MDLIASSIDSDIQNVLRCKRHGIWTLEHALSVVDHRRRLTEHLPWSINLPWSLDDGRWCIEHFLMSEHLYFKRKFVKSDPLRRRIIIGSLLGDYQGLRPIRFSHRKVLVVYTDHWCCGLPRCVDHWGIPVYIPVVQTTVQLCLSQWRSRWRSPTCASWSRQHLCLGRKRSSGLHSQCQWRASDTRGSRWRRSFLGKTFCARREKQPLL